MIETTPEISTTFSEELAEDATPKLPPENAPDLIPVHKMNRRKRLQFVKQLKVLSDKQESYNFTEETKGESLDDAIVAMDLAIEFEEALRLAAKDETVFNEWAKNCTDVDLFTLGDWFMNSLQVGEASASSS